MEYLERRRDRVEERLEAVLDSVEPEELADEVRHVALSGGKRVRPTVTVLVCEALGGEPADAVDFAVGIELVHNASLVIDDIIDESELRRGSPAAWEAFGHGPAIIASDGLLGEAFNLFSTDERAMQTVSESMVELGEGEAMELVAEPSNEKEYMELARRKTGALFRAAAELGAIAADSDPYTVEAVGQYAERVGVAFQMRDDVLDATADAETLGKPAGTDAEMERPSLVEVTELTTEEANERARAESDAALESLSTIDAPESQSMEYLRDLAEFVVVRER
ncbi:farnesyl-diphosphate synthase [Haloarcula quadrata]|jgi:geranylgeranyl diphosphate synthase type I|uniref:Farnesyl-pyrrophosphate synthase n=4 Tax=Haloarcula TaxID=2237 RepID=Q5UY00_HALMA|nr:MULTISPECIES: polyprenyl synthetase family protein [Haloarcula]AAV47853.1 farnesyl-pyrrophosphate synthase [Haloarcula marismortui ATCC 43049]EMA12140.1 farnesyl-pyrrophosphate synthase [Haloarcula sinaiiensis ATCC 33800]EMA17708.1 farnesyl-pyrrophosphate synthase [Haloarcula californiae ATCC 33799]NHN64296.1 polyprenyl synthetase family protein [Haloarcula sp. JP-Z28]NHX39426.1 polyprenyl synthetase family protein [Haloarcula sp. R1-2]